MEWWMVLALIFGGLIFLMLTGMPVAFSFLFINAILGYILWGGAPGLQLLINNIFESVTIFTLLPIPLFILMGEVMYHSGLVVHLLDSIDKWLGRLPGRLGLLAVIGGALLSCLTGASMGSTAMLGSTLVPEMEKRGYKKPMSLGPILGSGGLAIMIPPSSLAVLLGAIGEISIGKLLIAIIIPGLIMATLYAGYIIGRCWLQPGIAPAYEVSPSTFGEKIINLVKYVLPMGFIVFLVIGVIIIGIATPTEAAATGTFGTFMTAAAYGRLNWAMLKKSIQNAFALTVIIFMIIVGATGFSQTLAFTGATQGMVDFTLNLPLSPIMIIIVMQIVLIFLGMFMGQVPIMLITLPIFMPVIYALKFDPVWFGIIFLINMEMALTSPPFGLSLFVMKSVAPKDTTMEEIYKAAFPFLLCDAIAMGLIIAFPVLALWLPSLMRAGG
ncbi:MAG: TRAP transporter large permease subunit [Deltaproteobacteria bacterium]|nr:TRAP transporter large permease subunit [Deltaproteobacteria bacterium]